MLNFLWQVCDSIQRVNFASLLPLELIGIIAGIWMLKNHRISLIWRTLLIILSLMILLRVAGGISGRRYFLPVVAPMLCFIPLLFETLKRLNFDKNISILIGMLVFCAGAGIAIGRVFEPHAMPSVVTEFVHALQQEYEKNPPVGQTVKFSGNTKRERQLLFYSGLPMSYEWMPTNGTPQSGVQYFREYGYKYNKTLPDQMDLYWLFEDPPQDEIEKTLEYMRLKHAFKLVSQYHSQISGNVILYHLQRNLKDKQ